MEREWADGSFSAAAVALRQRQSNGGAEVPAFEIKALRWRRWNEADEIIMILLKKDEKST